MNERIVIVAYKPKKGKSEELKKLVASAVGEGSIAVQLLHQYFSELDTPVVA